MTVEKILLLKYVNKAFTILSIVEVPLKQDKLRKVGIGVMKISPITEFIYTIVCFLTDYTGWALFIDCDFISQTRCSRFICTS